MVRFPYSRPVSYRVTGGAGSPPDEIASRGEIVNLSNKGLGMRTQGQALEEGTVIQAWVPVTSPPVTLPVLTQVKWVKEEQPGAYQIGLWFVL